MCAAGVALLGFMLSATLASAAEAQLARGQDVHLDPIDAIARGRWIPAMSVGLDPRQAMRHVIAPQALRVRANDRTGTVL